MYGQSIASATIAEQRSFDGIEYLLKTAAQTIAGYETYGGVVRYPATKDQVLSNEAIIELLATNDVVIVTVSVST